MNSDSIRAPAHGWWTWVLAALTLAAVPEAMAAGDARTLVVSAQPAARKEQRLALVIGNNAYAGAPLLNPVNDARAMAAALERSGFTVLLRTDANQRDMLAAVREFGSRLREGGSGVFYFAGHGMQIKGRNYLIPVGADIQREDEVAYQALDAQAVLDKMETAGNGTNLMILDACRNNPFARSFRSTQQGLAQMDAPVGTLVAFATSPGSVSSDGSGQHGLYTEYLLRSIAQPGLKVEDVFKQVRAAVRRDSQGRQIPWESTSLEGDFFFLPPAPVVQAPPPPPPPPPTVSPEAALELALWEAVRDSTQPLDLQAYLKRFPQGGHVTQVRERLARLTPPPPPSPPAPAPTLGQLDLPAATGGPNPGRPLPAGTAVPVLPSVAAASVRLPALAPVKTPASDTATVPAVPTTPAQGYAVGDRWRFQVVDKWKGEVVRNYTAQIDRIDRDGSLLLQGGSRLDALGRPLLILNPANRSRVEYSAAPGYWWDGMQPGQRRSQKWRQDRVDDAGLVTRMEVDATIVVKGYERVRVPGGEFNALRIEVEAQVEGQPPTGSPWWNRWANTYWYAPELRYYVAADFETLDAARGTRLNRERVELTSYEQRVGPLAVR